MLIIRKKVGNSKNFDDFFLPLQLEENYTLTR